MCGKLNSEQACPRIGGGGLIFFSHLLTQSPPGPEGAWNPTGVRVGGVLVLDQAQPPAFGPWTGGKGLGAGAYFLKIWRLLGVCVCFRAIVLRVVQFGSLWQLGTRGGECPSRVQSASGPIFAGCARPLEAMASTPLTGAHPLPAAMPF